VPGQRAEQKLWPIVRLAVRILLGMVAIGALLFIPAGGFGFWQGWAYLMIWFVPGLTAFLFFCKHNPELVRRRLEMKEKVREQKLIMGFVYLTYWIAFFGLDHRFSWSRVPLWLTIVSLAVVFGGYVVTLWVMKVNRFRPNVARQCHPEGDSENHW
jgi:hypothetical protein